MRYFNLMTIRLITAVFLLSITVQAQEYKPPLSKGSASGIEVRLNGLYSSGRFVQDITSYDASDTVVQTDKKSSDLTTKGFSLLLGFAREYRKREQSSFLYMGYERQKWNDAYDSDYHAFVVGVEGGVGSRKVKFIYGGEFAFGALDTGKDGLGYLSTFTGEPYIGLRLLSSTGLSLNFRVGARGYYIEGVEESITNGSVSSENSAYTANVQLGIGYRFY